MSRRRIEPIEGRTLLEAELNDEEKVSLQIAMEGCQKDKDSVAAAVRILIHRQRLQPRLYSYDFEEIHDISGFSVSILRKYLTRFNNVLNNRVVDLQEIDESSRDMKEEDTVPSEANQASTTTTDVNSIETPDILSTGDNNNLDGKVAELSGNNADVDVLGESEPTSDGVKTADIVSALLRSEKKIESVSASPSLSNTSSEATVRNKNSREESPHIKEEEDSDNDNDSQYTVENEVSSSFSSVKERNTRQPRKKDKPLKVRRPHDVDAVPREVVCVLNGEDVSAIVWNVCFGGSRYRSLSERIPLAVAVGRILMRVETAAEACIRTGIPQGTVTNYERRAEVAIFKQREKVLDSEASVLTPVRPPSLSLIDETKQLREMKFQLMQARRPSADLDQPSAKRACTTDADDECITEVFDPIEVDKHLQQAQKDAQLAPNLMAALRCILLEGCSVKMAAQRFVVLNHVLSIWKNSLLKAIKGKTSARPPAPISIPEITVPLCTSVGYRIPKKEHKLDDTVSSGGGKSRSSGSPSDHRGETPRNRDRDREDRDRDYKRKREDREKDRDYRDRERDRERDGHREKGRDRERERDGERDRSRSERKREYSDNDYVEEEIILPDELLEQVRKDVDKMLEFSEVSPAYHCLSDAILDILLVKRRIREVSQNRRIPASMLNTFVQMAVTVLKAKEY